MKNTLFICIALIAISPSIGWCEEAPRQSMKEGVRFYESKSYDRAAESFGQAAQSAQREKLDVSVARYNAANARFKMGQFGAAATNFADAMRSPNLSLQSKAYYNRGNALALGAESDEKGGRLDTAVRSMDEALAMYENAMTLSPKDEDAKINYELGLKKKQELEQKQKQQQQQNKQDQKQQKDSSQEQKDQQKDQQQKQDQQKNKRQPDPNKDQQKQEQLPSQQQSADQPQKEQSSQPKKSEEMTPEEARMMLDAMKQEEQASRDRLRMVIGQPSPVDKDW